MSILSPTTVLLRQVPEHLQAGIDSGDYKIYGSVIRSILQGRFVGHLQETGGLAKAMAHVAMTPVAGPLQAANVGIDVVGHVTSFVQNEQIKAAIATLRGMQIAGLALGVAGIGVSIAGFAILSQKISRVEAKIESFGDKIEIIARKVDSLRRDQIAGDFVRLRTAGQRMEEGWQLSSPETQWGNVASEAHLLQNRFSQRADEILQRNGAAQLAAADPFLEALALASAVRISARLAAGEEVVARQAAQEGAELLIGHSRRFSIADAALAMVREKETAAATPEWGEELQRSTLVVKPVVDAMRGRAASAVSTSLTLDELHRQQISGREWMEAAHAEQEAPFVFLASVAA